MHTLEEAQNYIEQNRIDKRKRPAFHVTAPVTGLTTQMVFQLTKEISTFVYQYTLFDKLGTNALGACC